MLNLLKQDAKIGDILTLYLVSGESVKGKISEIGDNYLLMEIDGVKRRYFPQVIGGWDVMNRIEPVQELPNKEENQERKENNGLAKSNGFEFGLISKYDEIYKKNAIELTGRIVTNATVESVTVSGVKVVTDSGENIICNKGFMVGFSRANCTPGNRIYCGGVSDKGNQKGICYLSILEMSYEELRTRYITAILTKPSPRKPVINSILSYLLIICLEKSTKRIIGDLRNRIKNMDDPIEFLLSRKEYDKVIFQLEKSFESSSDNKQKISLLLKKAQLYSSLKDNDKAIDAYKSLISFSESIDATAKNLSRFYTELARLLFVVGDFEKANEAKEKALDLNPQNAIARRIGNYSESSILDNNNTLDKIENSQSVKGEFYEVVKLLDKRLVDDDVDRHSFVDSEIVSLNGEVTNEIANRLLEEASTSEDYLPYLEAAKALKQLPVGSYDIQNYEESLTYYSLYKCMSLHNSYKKLLFDKGSLDKLSIEQLEKLKDSTICYSLEAIDYLLFEDAEIAQKILSDCLFIELSSWILLDERYNKMIDFEVLSSQDIISYCINSNLKIFVPRIFLKLIFYSLQCEHLWEKVVMKMDNYRKFLNYVNNNKEVKTEIIKLTPPQKNLGKYNGNFVANIFEHEKNRLKAYKSRINKLWTTASDASNIIIIQRDCSYFCKPKNSRFSNDTDVRCFSNMKHIASLLSKFTNRKIDNRERFLSSLEAEIDELLKWNTGTTTLLGRFFFYPLLLSWKEHVIGLEIKKQVNKKSILSLELDPPYYSKDGDKYVFCVVINNNSCLISEGYKLSIKYREESEVLFENNKDILPNTFIHLSIEIPINSWGVHDVYELTFSICSQYLGVWSQETQYSATIAKKREVSFSNGIKWSDGGYPPNEMFKGRDEIIHDLQDHYTSEMRRYSYVLYGLSKTGKSSILNALSKSLEGVEIQGKIKSKVILPLFLDLGAIYGDAPKGKFWNLFINSIWLLTNKFLLKHKPDFVNRLSKPNTFNQFVLELNELNIHPLFMLDEFSYMQKIIDKGYINSAFLQNMRSISVDKDLASFIFAGTYDIKSLIYDPKYNISGAFTYLIVPDEPLFSISRIAAEELINSMKGELDFTTTAINEMHRLTGDVPFWIQKLCFNCAMYAIDNNKPDIGFAELETVVRKMTGEERRTMQNKSIPRLTDGTFSNSQFLNTDTEEMKIVLTSIAYLINAKEKVGSNSGGVTYDEIKALWEDEGVDISLYNIKDAIASLCERKTLAYEDYDDMRHYFYSVDLFRRWWHHIHLELSLELSTFKKQNLNDKNI